MISVDRRRSSTNMTVTTSNMLSNIVSLNFIKYNTEIHVLDHSTNVPCQYGTVLITIL